MTATAHERSVAAVQQRAGRDLLAYVSRGGIALAAATDDTVAAKLKRADRTPEGYARFPAVPILKAGSFHGGYFSVDGLDLAAMVQRFAVMRDDLGFVAPIRFDHGWSIRDVIGHIEAVSLADRPDPSDTGTVKPYLLADLVIYDDADAAAVLRWDQRSSEVGGYETNTGTVYSLALWGLAFVDTPAVEGLGKIELGASRPHKLTILNEEPDVMSVPSTEATTAPATETEAPTGGAQPDPAPGASPESEVENGTGDDDTTADDATGDDTGDAPVEEPQTGGDSPAPVDLAAVRDQVASRTMTPAEALRSLGMTDAAAALDRADAERVSLEMRTHEQSGVIGAKSRAAAESLLSHRDEDVRRHARDLLATLKPAAKLNQQRGTAGPGGAAPSDAAPRITPDMSLEEFSTAWSELSTEQRADKTFLAARNAWLAANTG